MQKTGESDDVLIGQWGSLVGDRSRERTGARVDAVEHQHMEVQIEIERAAEPLRDDDRSRAAVEDAGACRPLAEPIEQRTHKDAPHRGTELGVVGQQIPARRGATANGLRQL